MNLEEENEILKKQLSLAQEWMKREIQSAQKEIILEKSGKSKNSFYHENLEDIISEKIYKFFPSEVLMNFPSNGVENIISSELIYFHIIQGGHVDGTGVIIGYQKIIDSMVELYISKGFRKFIEKQTHNIHLENIPLEKSFHSIITKKYIFSLGRLYESLKKIKSKVPLSPYLQLFHEYIEDKSHLKKALLESDFLLQLEILIDLHAISEKRHEGTLSASDTTKSRNACIGNFENKNCLLYILAESQT